MRIPDTRCKACVCCRERLGESVTARDSPHLSRTRAYAASAARDPTVLDAKTAVHVNRAQAVLLFSCDRLAVKLALGMTIGMLPGEFALVEM